VRRTIAHSCCTTSTTLQVNTTQAALANVLQSWKENGECCTTPVTSHVHFTPLRVDRRHPLGQVVGRVRQQLGLCGGMVRISTRKNTQTVGWCTHAPSRARARTHTHTHVYNTHTHARARCCCRHVGHDEARSICRSSSGFGLGLSCEGQAPTSRVCSSATSVVVERRCSSAIFISS
jgi:hypothetical protein